MPSGLLPGTLGLRLTLVYAVAFIVFLSTVFFFLYISVQSVIDRRIDEDLIEDIQEFSALYVVGGDTAVVNEVRRESQSGDTTGMFLRVFDLQGNEIVSSDLEKWAGLGVNQASLAAVARGDGSSIVDTLDIAGQSSETRIIYGSISSDRIMYLGESLQQRDEIMKLLLLAFTSVFLLSVPLTAVLVWWLTQRALRGIRSVCDAARDIQSGNLGRRVRTSGQVDEVQNLADAFDSMAMRIQSLIGDMRAMTDNIAHDLRSPLARIRVISESALLSEDVETEYRKAAGSTIYECDRLIQMINISLDVSEAESGVSREPEKLVDFTALTEDACELFESLAETKDITLYRNISEHCRVWGNTHSLQRMFANILDNAIKFSRPSGRIDVTMRLNKDLLELSVKDAGIGIPADKVNRVFERFFRCDNSRSVAGCGLGLSYSRAVARSHGGDITVISSAGEFTCFVITLPAQLRPRSHAGDTVALV